MRRLWVARETQRHSVHVRLLRAELMQALARDESAFVIDHWSRRDRKAALEVASQLLGIIKGRDRQKLEAIVESNHILNKALLRINRISKRRRIAEIRVLAVFGNRSVQGTLEHLMLNDPSNDVRLEAAIAITVAGQLPGPWNVIRAVCDGITTPCPNHYRLFEAMMPEKCDAMLALATFQEDRVIRLLAIHALGFADTDQATLTLRSMLDDGDAHIVIKARESLDRVALVCPNFKPLKKSAALYLVDKKAA